MADIGGYEYRVRYASDGSDGIRLFNDPLYGERFMAGIPARYCYMEKAKRRNTRTGRIEWKTYEKYEGPREHHAKPPATKAELSGASDDVLDRLLSLRQKGYAQVDRLIGELRSCPPEAREAKRQEFQRITGLKLAL